MTNHHHSHGTTDILPTAEVKMKDSGHVARINLSDFDKEKHELVTEAKPLEPLKHQPVKTAPKVEESALTESETGKQEETKSSFTVAHNGGRGKARLFFVNDPDGKKITNDFKSKDEAQTKADELNAAEE